MIETLPGPLVDAEWVLEQHDFDDPRVVILDSSSYLPTLNRDARAEFAQRRLPGARFFDFDGTIKDPKSELPHMLPDAALFEREVRKLGVNRTSLVICYDCGPMNAAPRAWWMFRAFGFDSVAVLNGGLPAWTAAGGPLETQDAEPARPGDFQARPRPELVADLAAVQAALDDDAAMILDARSAGRFNGTAPEPRPGLRAGHMPGALNLPYDTLLDPDSKTMRPPQQLRAAFENIGANPDARIITTCGSGVTAAVLSLAWFAAGYGDSAVYDGSWTEWGGRSDTPVIA